MKRWLASILCATMVLSQVWMTQTVRAAEDYSALETSESVESSVFSSSEEASTDVSEAEASADGSSELLVLDEEVEEVATDASVEASKEAADEEADNDESILPEGISEIAEEYEMSFEEAQLKRDVISHEALQTIDELSEGVEYVPDQVIALADSRQEAETIASIYSGELLEYSYGVATISLADSALSVSEAFEYSLNESYELPLVEPNYISTVIEPEIESPHQSYGGADTAGRAVPSGNGFADRWWVDWVDGDGNRILSDEYLNPESETYQWFHNMVHTYSAWGVTTGSSGITVAVIDTGVNASNTDIDDNVIVRDEPRFVGANDYEDLNDHGTHVAGIIAAELNDNYGAGIAPKVKILPIRVNDGATSRIFMAEVVRALYYVAGWDENGDSYVNGGTGRRADIVNMSIGSSSYSAAEQTAVTTAYNAGVTLVAAMGNSQGSNSVHYPAAYDHIIAVAAVDPNGNVAGFSTVGPWADIAAPGVNIYSTNAGNKTSDPYRYMSGTSQATPVVSGACALYMSAVGHVDPDTMERVLKSSVTGSAGAGTGVGILDIAKMFNGDTTPPRIKLTANNSSRTLLGQVQDGKQYNISTTVANDYLLFFEPMNYGGSAAANENTVIVYTADGTMPSVYNGNIINGSRYYDDSLVYVRDITGEINTKTKITVKAAAVTGMGVMGKVSTLTFTVDPSIRTGTTPSQSNYQVQITNAPGNLVAGKTYTFTADVTSDNLEETVSQKVTWRIEGYSDGDLSKAKIDASSGRLTLPAGKEGKIIISCTSENTLAKDSVEVNVNTLNAVNKMEINNNQKLDLSISADGTAQTKSVSLSKLTDAKGNSLIGDGSNDLYQYYGFTWISSNENVFTVNAQDYPSSGGSPTVDVIATGAGTATLTCKAMDGSGKSAKITVTVASALKTSGVVVRYIDYRDHESEINKALDVDYDCYSYSIDVIAYHVYENNEYNPVITPIWSSSNQKVAKIQSLGKDDDGKCSARITIFGKGNSQITCTAADGSGKKLTFKLNVNQLVSGISITGQKYIPAGGSAKYTATVRPATANNKTLTWSILVNGVEDTSGAITVSGGTVKVDKNVAAGTKFTVKATSSNGVEESFDVEVQAKATKVTAAVAGGCSNVIGTSNQGSYATSSLITAEADNGTTVAFTSSNTKIATVIDNGDNSAVVNAVGKGTCNIIATAQDGSKKSASIKFNVVVPVRSMVITGQSAIAVGSKATFKANVLPSNANDKKVKWSLSGDYRGVSINETTGQVTVDKNAEVGEQVMVIASANDQSGFTDSALFTISSLKTTAVEISAQDTTVIQRVHTPVSQSGTLKSIRLYDTNIPDTDNFEENAITLTSSLVNVTNKVRTPLDDIVGVQWSSSNTKVATVVQNMDAYGRITSATIYGHQAGTANITCATNDGSGKKATVKVTVITPAAGLNITASKGTLTYLTDLVMDGLGVSENITDIAGGATVTLTCKPDTSYGKPTITKTTWDYEYGYIDYSNNPYTFIRFSDSIQADIVKNKRFYKFANGKVTADGYNQFMNNAIYIENTYGIYLDEYECVPAIRVLAHTTDGTEYTKAHIVDWQIPVTTIGVYDDYGNKYTSGTFEVGYDDGGYSYIYDDLNVFAGGSFAYMSVTSNKPNVASGYVSTEFNDYEASRKLVIIPRSKGTATLTITALDGSNKKTTFTVKVK